MRLWLAHTWMLSPWHTLSYTRYSAQGSYHPFFINNDINIQSMPFYGVTELLNTFILLEYVHGRLYFSTTFKLCVAKLLALAKHMWARETCITSGQKYLIAASVFQSSFLSDWVIMETNFEIEYPSAHSSEWPMISRTWVDPPKKYASVG